MANPDESAPPDPAVPHGDAVVPHGDAVVPHGDAVVPHGDPLVPRGDPVVPPGDPILGAGVPGVVVPPPDYSAQGVPSLDFVRDKIEGRYAQSLGSAELASQTPEARSAAEQQQDREQAAKDKLEAIRRSMRGGGSS